MAISRVWDRLTEAYTHNQMCAEYSPSCLSLISQTDVQLDYMYVQTE